VQSDIKKWIAQAGDTTIPGIVAYKLESDIPSIRAAIKKDEGLAIRMYADIVSPKKNLDEKGNVVKLDEKLLGADGKPKYTAANYKKELEQVLLNADKDFLGAEDRKDGTKTMGPYIDYMKQEKINGRTVYIVGMLAKKNLGPTTTTAADGKEEQDWRGSKVIATNMYNLSWEAYKRFRKEYLKAPLNDKELRKGAETYARELRSGKVSPKIQTENTVENFRNNDIFKRMMII
jgi:hypothetical protein